MNASPPSQALPIKSPVSDYIERTLVLLRDYAGFYPTTSLKNKLDRLFGRIDATALEVWIAQLESSRDTNALNALVEDLTNHETYFFREKIQLDTLSDVLLPALIQRKKQDGSYCVRVWSAACATGEEPYSLAMICLAAFVKAGIARETQPGHIELPAPWRLEIMATDISRQALKIAKHGIYTHRKERLNPFRQMPETYMRFFEPSGVDPLTTDAVYRVNNCVRQLVHFDWFNLKHSVPLYTNMDIVFCRNVLIYIDTREHGNVQNMLAASLNKNGCLFLGLVDSLSESARLHVNHQHACGFYERK